MNRDDILRMAREAGFQITNYQSEEWNIFCSDGIITDQMEEFARMVAAAVNAKNVALQMQAIDEELASEREACAGICDRMSKDPDEFLYVPDQRYAASHCASAIRARGTNAQA